MEHSVTRTTILHLTLYLLSSVRPVVYMEKILCCTAKYVKMWTIHILFIFLILPLWCMVMCFNVIHFSLIAMVLKFSLNANGCFRNCYLDLIVQICSIKSNIVSLAYGYLSCQSKIRRRYELSTIKNIIE